MWFEERRRMANVCDSVTTLSSRFNEIALNLDGVTHEIKHACLPYWLKIS